MSENSNMWNDALLFSLALLTAIAAAGIGIGLAVWRNKRDTNIIEHSHKYCRICGRELGKVADTFRYDRATGEKVWISYSDRPRCPTGVGGHDGWSHQEDHM